VDSEAHDSIELNLIVVDAAVTSTPDDGDVPVPWPSARLSSSSARLSSPSSADSPVASAAIAPALDDAAAASAALPSSPADSLSAPPSWQSCAEELSEEDQAQISQLRDRMPHSFRDGLPRML
jgi:hypothetical protein